MSEYAKLEELVVGWFDRGCIGVARKPDEFMTLASDRKSPHYVNFRQIMSLDATNNLPMTRQRHIRSLTIDAAATCIDTWQLDFDHLAPIPQAVTQLGGAIAVRAGLSSLNVRVKETEKGYGKHQPIEGDYQTGDRVVGFDDVVSTGITKQNFLYPMFEAGLTVPGFMTLVDRAEGGREYLRATGRELVTVADMPQAADILRSAGRITITQYGFMQDYFATYGDQGTSEQLTLLEESTVASQTADLQHSLF